MARKAQLHDIRPGRTLWMRDHRAWLPVVIEDVYWGSKGPKITYQRPDGTQGKQALTAFYGLPPAGASPSHGWTPRPDTEIPSPATLPPNRVAVEARDGQSLSPCTRDKARALVGLGLALWIEPSCLRLTYDVWAGSAMSRRIIGRDHGICTYCGQPATSVDHLLARSQGGLTQPDNLVAACHHCNQARGDRFLEIWLTRYPAAADHPVIAAYLAAGGTPTHCARMESLFADGIPDPRLCADSNDARQWIKRYRQHYPNEWARWMQSAPDVSTSRKNP